MTPQESREFIEREHADIFKMSDAAYHQFINTLLPEERSKVERALNDMHIPELEAVGKGLDALFEKYPNVFFVGAMSVSTFGGQVGAVVRNPHSFDASAEMYGGAKAKLAELVMAKEAYTVSKKIMGLDRLEGDSGPSGDERLLSMLKDMKASMAQQQEN